MYRLIAGISKYYNITLFLVIKLTEHTVLLNEVQLAISGCKAWVESLTKQEQSKDTFREPEVLIGKLLPIAKTFSTA